MGVSTRIERRETKKKMQLKIIMLFFSAGILPVLFCSFVADSLFYAMTGVIALIIMSLYPLFMILNPQTLMDFLMGILFFLAPLVFSVYFIKNTKEVLYKYFGIFDNLFFIWIIFLVFAYMGMFLGIFYVGPDFII